MTNRELQQIYELAKYNYLNSHNSCYESHLQTIACILEAFVIVHGREYPGQPLQFTAQVRQQYQPVDYE